LENTVLGRAAAEYGIEPEYIDIWGRAHLTHSDVTGAILLSLGAGASEEAIRQAVEERHSNTWFRALDATLVVREDAESIAVRIPAERVGGSVKLEIEWEGGEVEHHWFWLPELPTLDTVSAGGREFIAKRFPLPRPLRLGYHDLRVYWVKDPELENFGESRFIVCPKRAFGMDRRVAGVAVSLYGLRSARNWGCGDFTDLRAAIDAFAPAGVAFIALNPLHAIPNRQPYNTSPYLPECSLYRNFIYLDVERVGDAPVDALEIEALRASEFVEYERVAKLKLGALRILFDRFLAGGGAEDFDRYVEGEGAPLHDFAVYSALDADIHGHHPDIWVWTDWPVEYSDPRSAEVAVFASEHRREVLFYKFVQWHLDLQLGETQAHALQKGMRVGLYHDLALATDRYGADLWAHRMFYAAGCRVGSPPDDFSPSGQDWSFPPPARDVHRADGYELFVQSIRKNARHGGALRIDHVMRFFRLWWIPDGMPATQGAYVRDYWENLLGVLALESVRGAFVVIGEDLGTVTGEVRQALAESGILGYRVLWFERNPDGTFRRPDEYPAQAAASSTTHDLPTLAGFAPGRDIEARRAAGLIDEAAYQTQVAARQEETWRLKDALRDAGFPDDPIGFLLSTPCALAIVNQEDLTGETEQQNLPGSTWQHPNWRRKMKVAVEDFGALADGLREKIQRAGR
jgi:4-alpha-glucanotransferase